MRNLKIWHKLALLGMVLLIPFWVVTYKLAQTNTVETIQPAREEISGLTYFNDLHAILDDMRLHRDSAAGFLNGDSSFASDLAESASGIAAHVGKVDADDQAFAALMNDPRKPVAWDTKTWEQAKAQCLDVVARTSHLSAADSYQQHNAAIDLLLALSRNVGDTSTLILDPDLDSYYLMDSLTVESPQLGEQLTRLRAIGIAAASKKHFSPDERLDALAALAKSRYLLDANELALNKAVGANASLGDKIGPDEASARSEITQFWDLSSRLLSADTIDLTPRQYFEAGKKAIATEDKLHDETSPLLRTLLQTRIDNLSAEVYLTVLYALLGLLVVSAFAAWGVRVITLNLNQVVTAADKIAVGDLDVSLPVAGGGDEVGVLAASFMRMTASLRHTAEIARRIADGDLRVQITPQSERDELGNAFAAMVANLQSMTAELADAATVMNSAAAEISASTSQFAVSATETAAAVSETSTTVEEVRQTAHLSNDKARRVADSALRAADVAQNGRQATEDATAGMNKIRLQMEAIADSMLHLSGQSQAIGDIISSVDDLAQQSNLLAVNAAIEAAKAGEQGKGFAVVAQEVRSLAEQSRQATTQVRTLLNDTQKASGDAVMAAEQGNKAVDVGALQSTAAGAAIHSLNVSVAEAAEAATQIAASSQQQLVGMDQVAVAMESIKQASNQSVESAQQLERSAARLNELGLGIKQLVERFQQ